MTPSKPRIALATCREKPQLTFSDLLLAQHLRASGAEVKALVWDQELGIPQFDFVIVRSVWDYHLKPQSFLNWLRILTEQKVGVFNSRELISWNIDKSYLLELKERGVPIVPTLLVNQNDVELAALADLDSKHWPRIVIKPSISAGARMTYLCAANDPELSSLIRSIQRESDAIIQPYRESVESEGEISLIFFRDSQPEYSHSVLKTPRVGEFRVQSDFGGTTVPFDSPRSLIDLSTRTLLQIPGEWLYARVDVIGGRRGPEVSEVELIEPDLYLNLEPNSAPRFAQAILRRIGA